MNISDTRWITFWQAVEIGDLTALDSVLTENPGFASEKMADGSTALHHAAERGSPLAVSALLSQDPDIDVKNKDGVTAPLLAYINCHEKITKIFNNFTFKKFQPKLMRYCII